MGCLGRLLEVLASLAAAAVLVLALLVLYLAATG